MDLYAYISRDDLCNIVNLVFWGEMNIIWSVVHFLLCLPPLWRYSSTAGQWNQVFVQPAPEEEVHIGADQDPRVRQHHIIHHWYQMGFELINLISFIKLTD